MLIFVLHPYIPHAHFNTPFLFHMLMFLTAAGGALVAPLQRGAHLGPQLHLLRAAHRKPHQADQALLLHRVRTCPLSASMAVLPRCKLSTAPLYGTASSHVDVPLISPLPPCFNPAHAVHVSSVLIPRILAALFSVSLSAGRARRSTTWSATTSTTSSWARKATAAVARADATVSGAPHTVAAVTSTAWVFPPQQ